MQNSIGIKVVKTYADLGKSGLTLKGREGLGNLLSDVVSEKADYSLILVYDVSRWGRFQDVDESAYYEFVCKRANVGVEYCAEPFRNDLSMPSTLLKTMKRTMAGEFSRELSVKVFAGQCRLIQQGFRQGGRPGYGLRRLLVDENRRPKQLLFAGQHKAIHTDRIILVPGTSDEVHIVQEIFQRFVNGESVSKIAHSLNDRGVPYPDGRQWTQKEINGIVCQPKYAGMNVFHRATQKLKSKFVRNPPEKWIVCENAFKAIVSPEQFKKAAQRIAARKFVPLTKEGLLAGARKILAKHGELSGKLINRTEGVPCLGSYRNHFGGIMGVYKVLGVEVPEKWKYLERQFEVMLIKRRHLAWIVDQLRANGANVENKALDTVITVNGNLTLSLRIATHKKTKVGELWQMGLALPRGRVHTDITIMARLYPNKSEIMDYYVFPRREVLPVTISLRLENGPIWESYRFDNLDFLFRLLRRSSIWEAKCRSKHRELATWLMPLGGIVTTKQARILPPATESKQTTLCANLPTNSAIKPG
jgi:DNA invertase Pin-like site-specific DNA recombinase